MPRRRFRWTRERYRKAAHLARFLDRYAHYLPDEAPALVQRYWELHRRFPQRDDPLLRPHWLRYPGDDIPF